MAQKMWMLRKGQHHCVCSPRGPGEMGRHFLTRRQKMNDYLKVGRQGWWYQRRPIFEVMGSVRPSLTMWSLLLENRCFIHYLKAMAAQKMTVAVGAGVTVDLLPCPAFPIC